MKKQIYSILTAFLLVTNVVILNAQDTFDSYQQKYPTSTFLSSQGQIYYGDAKLRILNNVLSLQIKTAFQSSSLKTGVIADVSTQDALPDIDLGTIERGPDLPTSYKIKIQNNKIVIESSSSESISSMDVTLQVDLTPENTTDNNAPYSVFEESNENYIFSIEPLVALEGSAIDFDSGIKGVTYYDGLGRDAQEVLVGGSPDKKDIVVHKEYDVLGRETKQYLPYESTNRNGAKNGYALTSTRNFYNTSEFENTTNPFSEMVYNESYQDARLLEQAAPGNPWKYDPTNVVEETFTKTEPNYDYQDYSISWPISTFLESYSGGGGGTVTFSVTNGGIVSLKFNAGGYNATRMKTGNVVSLGIDLPDTELGPLETLGEPTGYAYRIKDNKINVYNIFQGKYLRSAVDELIVDIRSENTLVHTERSSSNHTIKYKYDTNKEYEVKRLIIVGNNANSWPTFRGSYAEDQLYKTITYDENWQPNQENDKDHSTEEFKDKYGRVVLKRTYNKNLPHDTYYVYDDLGNLRYVIPPKASDIILTKNYEDYEMSFNFGVILNQPVSGGGSSIKPKVENNTFSINFGAGHSSTTLKEGKVFQLNPAVPIPDMILGNLTCTKQDGTVVTDAYEIQVRDNYIFIKKNYEIGNIKGHGASFSIPIKGIPKDATSASIDPQVLYKLCYHYRYDHKNRLVEKNLPGKDGFEYIVYNQLDQPVLTQDPNQRLKSPKEWLFTKYDAFGRVAYTGVHQNNSTRAQLQTLYNGYEDQFVTKSDQAITIAGTTIHYDNSAQPTSVHEIHTINYYDNYVFDTPNANAATAPNEVFDQEVTSNAKGLSTGSKVRILGTNQWAWTINYYDQKGRSIYQYSYNQYLDAEDIMYQQLDFRGKVVKARSRHQKGGNDEIVTLYSYTYDHQERLLDTYHCIGDDSLPNDCSEQSSLSSDLYVDKSITQSRNIVASNSITLKEGFSFTAGSNRSFSAVIQPQGGVVLNENAELIASNSYDKIGRLITKKVGNKKDNPLQEVNYAYNVRGWLKRINNPANLGNDLFSFGINYNTTTENLGATALYNGNISETIWKTANDNTKRAYGYQYDAVNRIVAGMDNSGDKRYSLSNISYDKNGNILSLLRKGHTNASATAFGIMDNLNYSYGVGNELLKVEDSGNTSLGFKEGTNTTDDYEYDDNGNMKMDRNKGITGITYNHLNLPETVSVNSAEHTGNIQYIYDATGVKLKKITTEGSSMTTEYAGGYVYKNENLEFFSHAEGYVEAGNDGALSYVFQYSDHLGNIRLSYSDKNKDGDIDVIPGSVESEILEENNYYPFGLKHKGYNGLTTSSSKALDYKYNGIELNNDLGLDWYDYGARNYDTTLGRWMNIDPLAENSRRWTPYNFNYNNPIHFIDPDGMQATDWYYDEDGMIVYDASISSQDDLDKAGIEGEYIADEFVGIDQDQGVTKFNEDGTTESSTQDEIEEGDTVVPIEKSSGEVTQDNKESKGDKFVTEAGAALVVSQGDSPAPGPGDLLALGILYNALKNLVATDHTVDQYTTLEFSKRRSKRKSRSRSKDSDYGKEAEHTKGKRPSTRTKHEKGQSRKGRDKGGEKGDKRRRRYK